MANKTVLCTVLTVVALLGCLGMTEAQQPPSDSPQQPAAITPESHHELTKDSTGSIGVSISSTAAGASEAAAAAIVSGWNFVHAVNCQSYFDGTTTWLYVYTREGSTWITPNTLFQVLIAPACQTGNFIAFYIFDISGGSWNQVLTYTFK